MQTHTDTFDVVVPVYDTLLISTSDDINEICPSILHVLHLQQLEVQATILLCGLLMDKLLVSLDSSSGNSRMQTTIFDVTVTDTCGNTAILLPIILSKVHHLIYK